MSSINKYLIYSLSLLLIILLNAWFLNKLRDEVKETYKFQQNSRQEIQYMTIRFNDAQQLDEPLIDKTYVRNGRNIEAASNTATPRVILSLFGKNEWDIFTQT